MSALLAADLDVGFVDLGVFMVAGAICIVGALGVVAARNPVHSALMLVMTLFGIAVLFVERGAHFLAAVQVMVYAGAIVVLLLFVIMLLGVDRDDAARDREPLALQRPLALIIGLLFLVQLGALTGRHWALGDDRIECLAAESSEGAALIEATDGQLDACFTDKAVKDARMTYATADDQPGVLVDLHDQLAARTETAGFETLTAVERADALATLDALEEPNPSDDVVADGMRFVGEEADGLVDPRALPWDAGADGIRKLARDIFTYHLLAFEATSALLITAVVAAVVLAKRSDDDGPLIDLDGSDLAGDDPDWEKEVVR